jgi:NAD(P)-dependent dehydrogenase (short-subunit alcohol dehydrogenase family)
MEVNFFGLLAVTKAAMAAMREQKPSGGLIQQVTSIGGQRGVPVSGKCCTLRDLLSLQLLRFAKGGMYYQYQQDKGRLRHGSTTASYHIPTVPNLHAPAPLPTLTH